MGELLDGIACPRRNRPMKSPAAVHRHAGQDDCRQGSIDAVDVVGTGGRWFRLGQRFDLRRVHCRGLGRYLSPSHGNRALSSRSARPMYCLPSGFRIDITPEHVGRCITEAGSASCSRRRTIRP